MPTSFYRPRPRRRAPTSDFALNNLAVRNNVRYSPPVVPLDGRPSEAEILSRIALVLYGVGVDGDPALVDEQVIAMTLAKETGDRDSPVAGRAVDELTAMLPPGPGYERRLDMMLRLGPYGDAFGARPDGLTLERLKAAPHGIDLGPLRPRLAEVLRTPSGRIELAPQPLIEDTARLRDALDRDVDRFVLIGRRHLRSNNSWMHNVPALAGGTNRCTLQIHPDDVAELGLADTAKVKGPGGRCSLRSSRCRNAAGRGLITATAGATTVTARGSARGGAARRQRQPAQRRQSARPAVRHSRSQWHPGRYRPRGLTSFVLSPYPSGGRYPHACADYVSSHIAVTEKLTVC